MPSTVYKGDLSEITFGHEAGLFLEHDYAGTFRIICSFDTGGNAANAPHHDLVKDTSVITFTGGAANTPVHNGILRYPNGMLVADWYSTHLGTSLLMTTTRQVVSTP